MLPDDRSSRAKLERVAAKLRAGDQVRDNR